MGSDTQQEDGILKDYFEDHIAEMTNKRQPLSELFKFEQADFAGRATEYRAHVTRNVGVGFVGEDSAFPDAGAQGHVPVRIDQRKLMARVRMTSESMQDSRKAEGAYVQNKRDEMKRIIDDIAKKEEYALVTDGRGVLALINEATPSGNVTLILDSPGGFAGADFGNRFVQVGMFIGAVNPATGALRAGICKVTACSTDGANVTTDAAPNAAWADNDLIVQAANSSVTDILDTSYEHAMMGFMGLFDDGTYRNNYFGVDRSVYGNYQTYVRASVGALSTDLYQQTSDVSAQKLGATFSRMICHHSIRRLHIQLTEPDRRYNAMNLMKPDPGTAAFKQGDLTMGEVPITPIRDFPFATMLLLDEQGCDAVRYWSDKGKWVDEDGSILVRVGTGSSGRDSFEGWYRKRYQNHVRQPGFAARLDGITGQSLLVVRAE